MTMRWWSRKKVPLPPVRSRPPDERPVSRDFTITSDRLTIHRFRLQQRKGGPGLAPPSVAQLLSLKEPCRCLDQVRLLPDRALYRQGISLYCLSNTAPRAVRVEVAGPDAEDWEILDPERAQTLDTALSGYEEWYAARRSFYDASYFNVTEEGSSGYRAADLAGALKAQQDFVAALLAEAPFRSSLEFGCATGAMVQALRGLGIDAHRIDTSAYAIGKADPSIRPYLSVGEFDALDRHLPPRDAVIGQEVFEHLPPREIAGVFRRIREVCGRWFFVTVPCTPHPGFTLIDSFDSLPKDVKNNPIQGHLTQASYWWWVAQAVLAGFHYEPATTNRIRRRWGVNSRWWNLLVFRPARASGQKSVEEALDTSLGALFEPLRQDCGALYVATGRLERREGELVIRATRDDYPGYAYYGPYAAAERGEVRVSCRIRVESWHPDFANDPSSPAAYLEICSNRGVRQSVTLAKHDFPSAPGRWFDFRASYRADGDRDIQVKIFHTAIADLEIGWPVECRVRG